MTVPTRTEPQTVPEIRFHRSLTILNIESPGPIPAIRQALKSMTNGQVLRVTTDYPGCETDLYVWAAHTNNPVLYVDKTAPRGFDFYILKDDPWPANVTVDTQHAPCPTPVLQARKLMLSMADGETLKLVTACAAAVGEVDAWVKSVCYQLLGITEDARGVYRFYIRK